MSTHEVIDPAYDVSTEPVDARVSRTDTAFDLVVAKLRRPEPRAANIRRASLIEKLEQARSGPIVSVVAPAGFGKTTLLGQWAHSDSSTFAWVHCDERDNDPKVLLTYVAEALNAVEPIDERVFEALTSMESSVAGVVVPRLASAFASLSAPLVLVLDDVHSVHNPECHSALSVLADSVPSGSLLVLSSRDPLPLRVARLRAEGRIVEIGARDLSLTVEEAGQLLRDVDVALDAHAVAALHQRTEGWPVGLYLAALAIRAGSGPETVASFGGADVFSTAYFESELLARISARQREFLTRTAVLDRMCGPLCDAALGLRGSGATLAELARSNMLLVPLDRRDEWYRYHRLFRDMLLAELEPSMVSAVQRRAAQWFADNGLPEEALEYSIAAGDVDRAAELVQEQWLDALMHGRDETLRRWIQWLDDRDGAQGHPMIAVAAAISDSVMGRSADADRWVGWIERWRSHDGAQHSDPGTKGWAAVTRAFVCRHGVEQMRVDADEAAQVLPAQHVMIPLTGLLQGVARVLSGDLESGDAFLEDSVAAGEDFSGPHHPIAVAERSLLAIKRADWDQAALLAHEARTLLRDSGLDQSTMAAPLVCAVQARVLLHRGDAEAAREQALCAQRLRPWLSYAIPYVAAQARMELTRVYLALGDAAGARTLMREVDEILEHRPRLGTIVDEAQGLRSQLANERHNGSRGASTLTAAELRLLPMIATHLHYREIAQELYLSHNTVRTQSSSIYRKLGVSSRAEAVARAREIGLIE